MIEDEPRDQDAETLILDSTRNALRRLSVPLVLETDLTVECTPTATTISVRGPTALWVKRHIAGREIHAGEGPFELTVSDRDPAVALRKLHQRLDLTKPLLSHSSGVEHLFGRRQL